MKYDFDSYFMYESTPQVTLTIRLKVVLKEKVNGDVLTKAAQTAFRRFPYYAKTLRIDEQGGHVLEPSDAPIVVKEEADDPVTLGSDETNYLFFCITYRDKSVYFNASHSFCGGCGALFWVKTTLLQYVSDLYHKEIDAEGILTPDTPVLPGETALPDLATLPNDEPLGGPPEGPSWFPMEDAMAAYTNPSLHAVMYPIQIGQKELMDYARQHDGTPNSILCVAMFKALSRLLRNDSKVTHISGKIACNYRSDVGCPDTYRDLVRLFRIRYRKDMADQDMERLSTVTRGSMYVQMEPELSWQEYRKLVAFREGIDSAGSHEEKVRYAREHSLLRETSRDSYSISYAGNSSWGGLAEYVDEVYSFADGHLMLEVNALPDKFCICFQQIIPGEKYLNAFLQVLDEEGIKYAVGPMEEKKLPRIRLPHCPA